MKIFVSHAHEQATIADALTLALRQDGHEVFFDRDALKAGEGFHATIRASIQQIDLLIFLVSPQSLESGSYARTELEIARERWPNPSGHVLPVLAEATPFATIPSYLTAVTVLAPQGDPVAETAARVASLTAREADRIAIELAARRQRVATITVALGLVTGGCWWALRPAPPSLPVAKCRLDVQVLVPVAGSAGDAGIANIDVLTSDGMRRGFVVVAGVASVEAGPLTDPDERWIIEASPADGSTPVRFNLVGCPSAPLELQHNDPRVVLQLAQRP